MNNYEKIYWLTRLDAIEDFVLTMMILGTVAIVGRMLYRAFTYLEGDKAEPIRWYTHLWFWSLYLSSIAAFIFVPTQKEAVIIFAGGKTIDFIEADSSIQKIPHQTTLLISNFMDKQIQSIETEIQKEKQQ